MDVHLEALLAPLLVNVGIANLAVFNLGVNGCGRRAVGLFPLTKCAIPVWSVGSLRRGLHFDCSSDGFASDAEAEKVIFDRSNFTISGCII